jgi:hypothetical protein
MAMVTYAIDGNGFQVLGSHSRVFGMGEDSVFNGMLPHIRDGVVSSISSGRLDVLSSTVDR